MLKGYLSLLLWIYYAIIFERNKADFCRHSYYYGEKLNAVAANKRS